MPDMKKSAAYEKLDKQEEKIEMKKKKIKQAEMEDMIRSIVRSELTRAPLPKRGSRVAKNKASRGG